MASDVTFRLSADEAQAVQAFQKLVNQQAKSERQFNRTTEAARRKERAMRRAQQTGMTMAKSLTGVFLGGGGLLAAWQAINAEIQNNIDLQRKAKKEQTDLAGARSEFITFTSGLSGDQFKKLDKQIGQITRRFNIPEKTITQAATAAFSTTVGDKSQRVSQTSQALRGSALLGRDQPQLVPTFAEGLVAIQKNLGPKFQAPKRQVGLLATIASQSRVGELEKLTPAIGPVLAAARAQGASPRSALAAFAGIGSEAEDPEGKRTRSGIIGILTETERFFRQNDIKDPGSFLGRLQAIQNNPEIRERFLGSQPLSNIIRGVPKQLRGPVRQLFTRPDSEFARTFLKLRERFTPEAAERAFNRLQSRRGGDTSIGTLRFEQEAQSATEQLRLKRNKDARLGVLQDELGNVLQASGESALQKNIGEFLLKASPSFGLAARLIRSRRAELSAPDVVGAKPPSTLNELFNPFSGESGVITESPTEREQQQIEILNKLLEAINEQREATKENTRAQERNSAGGRNRGTE